MDRDSITRAREELLRVWGDVVPPQAAREALHGMLERMPDPEEQAAVELIVDDDPPDAQLPALLSLAGGVLFMTAIVPLEGEAVGGHCVSVRRIPLQPDRSRIKVSEWLVDEAEDGTFIVRRWRFEFADGTRPLQFETRVAAHRDGRDHVENFARALAADLGWRQE